MFDRRAILAFCVLIAGLIVAGGCHKTDERNGIVGTVAVTGGSSAGVQVDLYEYPTFSDTDPWGVTAAYPVVGFTYTTSAGFDYRRESSSLLASVSTGSGGGFNFPNLENGQYIVVAHADSFGWSRALRVDLAGSKADVGALHLYRENPIARNLTITADTRWLAGQHYVLEGRLYVGAGATLTIEPGAVVRVGGENEQIIVAGTLLCEGTPDSFIVFTSDHNPPDVSDWTSIAFTAGSGSPLFRYCTFNYGESGIVSATTGALIEYCSFAKIGSEAIDVKGAPEGTVDSVIIRRNVIDHISQSIRVVQVNHSGVAVERNVIQSPTIWGIRAGHVYGGVMNCNWLFNCGREDTLHANETGGIFLDETGDLTIAHNEIQSSWWAFSLGARVDSSTVIRDNHISRVNRVINIGSSASHAASYPQIRHNGSEHCDGFYVYVGFCPYNYKPIDADSNWWGGYDGTPLENVIFDCVDDHVCGCVVRNVVLTTRPDAIGLCVQ